MVPEGYRHARAVPGRDYTLKKAAEDNRLLIVRCYLCRRPAVRYLASDLLAFCDPNGWADAPPFPCSKCGTAEYVKVKLHLVNLGDYGHLTVRRPGPVRRIQTWRNVKLGD